MYIYCVTDSVACCVFSTTYCGHLPEHVPEDGHNRWPKHIEGYTVYSTINLHICIYAVVGCIYHNESSVHDRESFNIQYVLLTAGVE